MKRSAAFLFLLLLFILPLSCRDDSGDQKPVATVTPPAATATPAQQQFATWDPSTLPRRDLVDLARRLRGFQGEAATTVNPTPPQYQVGDKHLFNMLLMAPPGEAREVPPEPVERWAVLRLITPHAYFYVEEGQDVSQEAIDQAGAAFEERIYPTVTAVMGREASPGIDNDPQITLFHGELQGAAGYFSDADTYPKAIHPLSNEREMLYLDLESLPPGDEAYVAVLAHELQHLIHFGGDRGEELWINEGFSQLAATLVGKGALSVEPFLEQPDTQLNTWDPSGDNYVHYAAADLFSRYLYLRTGDGSLQDFVSSGEHGIEGIDAFLKHRNAGFDFQGLFGDWLVANYLDETEGIYSYPQADIAVTSLTALDSADSDEDTVHQFGADYIEVGGDGAFTFDGGNSVPSLANEPHSGRSQWWSARGDDIDTTLTREFDLTNLDSATLRFWTWFDIEKWYDFGYVEASTDGGETWQALAGRHTTTDDPVRQAYGPGYTGRSGGGDEPEWVEEKIDLTPFAGKRILLLFEYVADGGVNAPGWAIDDIRVPELDFVDDAESAGDWQAEGFRQVSAPLQQRFLVQVIEIGDKTLVRQIELDAANDARIELRGKSEGVDLSVVVISAVTEGTTEIAPYRYSFLPTP